MKKILKTLLKRFTIVGFNFNHRVDWVKSICQSIPSGSSVIDVGAGGGPFKKFLAHCEYKSQDFCALSDVQLEEGGYSSIDFVSDITSIPVESNSFDYVLCTEVLEHVPNPVDALREMTRILKKGGTLILTAPLGSGLHQEPYHFYGGYTPHFYIHHLNLLGFSNIIIKPNMGTISHFGQMSLEVNFILFKDKKFFVIAILLFPTTIIFNLIAGILDNIIKDYRFTVGYFVKAEK